MIVFTDDDFLTICVWLGRFLIAIQKDKNAGAFNLDAPARKRFPVAEIFHLLRCICL